MLRCRRKFQPHCMSRSARPIRDLAAIGSASGQLGFLEQTTGSATILRSAAGRLKYHARDVIDVDMPRMTWNRNQEASSWIAEFKHSPGPS